ncbi:tyrosine--tRNA ligase [Spiroplasma endosymbiont of Anurida maritima]|uniref:tyrosine--tRNA ligase n=1 Tax=Spiroplasma endosymbiont of Anurida maritima TaxID=2967972 RepID=UPI0036D3E11D
MANNIIEELEWRGILKQVTNVDKVLFAQKNKKAIYCGIDPTADSLHIGHFLQLVILKHFENYNFKPIVLIGGATGSIGDPSGKSEERKLQSLNIIDENAKAIKSQLNSLIPGVNVLNNKDWLGKYLFVDFLRDVGKYFNISYLLNKDIISSRIESGLSYTEFSYNIMQAYDFYYLYKNNDCFVQLGGSDQWGNIVSGTDYIRKQVGEEENNSCGVTANLLLKKDGTKFGKTETGTIWLDKNKTTVYQMYQFLLNEDDENTFKLLYFLTFLSKKEIENTIEKHKKDPKNRHAQKILAKSIISFIHSEDDFNSAVKISEAIFNNNFNDFSEKDFKVLESVIPVLTIEDNETLLSLNDKHNIAKSRKQLREFLAQKAISVNNNNGFDENYIFSKKEGIFNKYFIIKKGKKNYFMAKFSDKGEK